MRERSPGAWELIVEAGRDPVTGKRRQASRIFNGTLTEAKKARSALINEVSKGRHTGTKATMNDLFDDWIVELQRNGRSPNTVHGYEKIYNHNIKPTLGRMAVTKVTTKTLTDLYGEHQRRGLSARSVHHIHGCVSSMFTQAAGGDGETRIRRSGPSHCGGPNCAVCVAGATWTWTGLTAATFMA